MIERVDAEVPADGRLGVVLGEHDWGYPFYGARMKRRLVTLSRDDVLREAEQRGLRVVLLGQSVQPVRVGRPWEVTRFSAGPTLIIRR